MSAPTYTGYHEMPVLIYIAKIVEHHKTFRSTVGVRVIFPFRNSERLHGLNIVPSSTANTVHISIEGLSVVAVITVLDWESSLLTRTATADRHQLPNEVVKSRPQVVREFTSPRACSRYFKAS